jgi:hypothetical protein
MAEGIVMPICARCQAAPARSPKAAYCAPCFAENKKQLRTANAAKQRRLSGAQEIGEKFACEVCGAETIRNSSFQRYCKPCKSEVARRTHRVANRKYDAVRPPRKRNKPIDLDRRKKWEAENKGSRRKTLRSYYLRNREEIARKAKEYRASTETRSKRRAADRIYRSRPKRRVDDRMKTAIKLALKGKKAGRSWESLVGYSLNDLIIHIERQFVPGMSWDNIGLWEIDHIRPRVMFQYADADDPAFKECWALTNLRPLWAKDNRSKHAQVLHLI